MSVWTVIGAVAASVLTAGILGGASGIMEIPSVVADVSILRTARENMTVSLAAQSERLRSVELSGDSLQRQITEEVAMLNALIARLDKKDAEDRAAELQLERDLAALNNQSKDRNIEVTGMVNALRSKFEGLADREKMLLDALSAVQQNVYDLAARIYRQGNQPSLPPAIVPPQRPYFLPPPINNSEHECVPLDQPNKADG